MYKLLLILLFGFGLSITNEEIYDNSWALLIGIDNYDNLKGLNYSVKDAQSIRKMLVDEFQFPPENFSDFPRLYIFHAVRPPKCSFYFNS